MRRRVLIVEADGTGHRLNYVRIMLEHASDVECTVLVPTSPTVDPYLDLYLNRSFAPFHHVERRADLSMEALEAVSRALHVDLVVIPDADRHLVEVARRLGWRGAGVLRLLLLRDPWGPSATRTASAATVRTAKRTLIRGLRRLSHIDVLALCPATGSPWQTPLAQVLDPIELTVEQREVERWGLSSDRLWFGVLGAISARKNVPLVASALLRASTSVRAGLLVAGPTDPEVNAALDDLQPQLESAGVEFRRRDGLLREEELDSAVAALDCVLLAHSNEGPSGLFGKALAAGTQVIASGAESLRRDCESQGGAVRWVPLQIEALAAAIAETGAFSKPGPRIVASPAAFAAALLR